MSYLLVDMAEIAQFNFFSLRDTEEQREVAENQDPMDNMWVKLLRNQYSLFYSIVANHPKIH